MQNLAIGIVLIVLALLVVVVFVFYQFGPEVGLAPAPNMELKTSKDAEPPLQLVVGGDRSKVAEQINEEARITLSPEHIKEAMEAIPGPVPPSEMRTLDAQHRVEHVVKRGETLTSLARRYLGDDKLWQQILEANPSLSRPEDLREGQTLLIPTR